MTKFFFAAVALLASTTARAADMPIVDLTLKNGIRVVLSPMPKQPLVVAGACGQAHGAPLDDALAGLVDCFRGPIGFRVPVLAVVGDFDPVELRARLEQQLGGLPRPEPTRQIKLWPTERRELKWIGDAGVRRPTVGIAYRRGPVSTVEIYSLLIARELLASIWPAEIEFHWRAVELTVKAPLPDFEAATNALEKLRRDPVAPEALARAREALRPFDDPKWRAERLVEWTLAFGDPRLLRDLPEGLQQLTPADVQRALARLLTREHRQVTEYRLPDGLPTGWGAPTVPQP